jgi:hypothetical protein
VHHATQRWQRKIDVAQQCTHGIGIAGVCRAHMHRHTGSAQLLDGRRRRCTRRVPSGQHQRSRAGLRQPLRRAQTQRTHTAGNQIRRVSADHRIAFVAVRRGSAQHEFADVARLCHEPERICRIAELEGPHRQRTQRPITEPLAQLGEHRPHDRWIRSDRRAEIVHTVAHIGPHTRHLFRRPEVALAEFEEPAVRRQCAHAGRDELAGE